MKLDNFNYKVEKKLGILSENGGKTKELNIVSYNNGKPKLDLRQWGEIDGVRTMFKGLTLSDDEGWTLKCLLEEYLEGKTGKA